MGREMSKPEDYMTTHEVADDLQVTVYTVRRWIRDGRLPAIKPGWEQQRPGRWRILRQDVDALFGPKDARRVRAPHLRR
jgi:excisionase family DNA binding protein